MRAVDDDGAEGRRDMAHPAEGRGGPIGPSVRRRFRFAPLAVIALAVAAAYAMGWQDHLSLKALGESRQALKSFVDEAPVLAAAVFVFIYSVAVALPFPAPSALTVAGGFLFGWLAGAALSIIAATTGATVLFLATRAAFGGLLRARFGAAAARLAAGFERDAFGYLLVLRLFPFVPFLLVNVAPALFDVRLKTFLAATLIGILPGALTFSFLGRGLDSVLASAAAAGHEPRLADLATMEITVALAALAVVAALASIARRIWVRHDPGAGRLERR